MELLGFIKEYNDLKESVELDSMLNSVSPITNDVEKIIHYLEQGTLLIGWMGYFFDVKTKKPIAPDAYFTDGVWVWPSYFTYYLKMYPSMQINGDFIDYLSAKDYNFKNDFESRMASLEKELSSKLNESA